MIPSCKKRHEKDKQKRDHPGSPEKREFEGI
jgi:hypothetical protein